MTSKENVINSLKEKVGEKLFNKASIIADERFGKKENLKIKFYQSIIEGYIDTSEMWTSDENVEFIKSKLEKSSDEDRVKIIHDIVNTYDTSDPKVRDLVKKYERYLNKVIPSSSKISIN